jgi:DNA transformation protein and related proteins
MIKQKLFCQQVVEQLGQVIEVKARAMFGGYGLYTNSVMFGLIDKEKLYFKVDAYNCDEYKALGMKPFIYLGKHKPIQMSYYQLPEIVFNNLETLSVWIDKAQAAAIKAKQTRKKISKKQTSSKKYLNKYLINI